MSTSKQREPFLTHYRTNILSKLREIDLFIKTQPAPYSKERVIKILDMPSSEFDQNNFRAGNRLYNALFAGHYNEKRLRRTLYRLQAPIGMRHYRYIFTGADFIHIQYRYFNSFKGLL